MCSCAERGLWWRWRHAPCPPRSPAADCSGMESDGRVGLDNHEQQISHLDFLRSVAASWPRRPFTHPLPPGDDWPGSAVWCAERRAPVWSSGRTGWYPRRGMLTIVVLKIESRKCLGLTPGIGYHPWENLAVNSIWKSVSIKRWLNSRKVYHYSGARHWSLHWLHNVSRCS